jgi:DNA-binding GntR family transcriptional regulator
VEQSNTGSQPSTPHDDAGGTDSVIALRTVSVVEAAADALREMVLDGTLEPGARLRETEYSGRLGIARHTFRAATQILIGEGLLLRTPNRGVQLAVLGPADIVDIFRLRAALELEATRLVIESGTPVPDAESAVERLNGLGDGESWRSVVDADMDFHRAIIEGAGSKRLARAYAGVQSEILLCMAQLRPHYDRPAEVALEHRELLEPIVAGDVELARSRMRVHLEEATENLTRALLAREEVTA